MRSYDPDVFMRAFIEPEDMAGVSPEDWLSSETGNVMFDVNGSVGLMTFERVGVYTCHWFFKVRGKEALALAREMLHEGFSKYGMKICRGLTPKNIPAARWAARKIGMTSHGYMDFPHKGLCEVFTLTKDDFYTGQK